MRRKSIMFLGTASSVGKSTLAAALCRFLSNRMVKTAPFNALDVSSISYVTKENLEIGTSTMVQAEACKITPNVCMNPILIKPNEKSMQIIVNGNVYANVSKGKKDRLYKELKCYIKNAYLKLAKNQEVIVLDGDGSSEIINSDEFYWHDTEVASMTDASIILVADTERNDVFASIIGTLQLLPVSYRIRVKGIIINKYRGNKNNLDAAIKQLERTVNIPVVGVIPYEEFYIDDDKFNEKAGGEESKENLDIAVIRLEHMSNFTDFSLLDRIEGITLRYVKDVKKLKNPDAIILPGTKNTIDDLRKLKEDRLFGKIKELQEKGTPVFGVCGGYQMLGKVVLDRFGIEGDITQEEGFGFLDIKTRFIESKITKAVEATVLTDLHSVKSIENSTIRGYEIHNGVSKMGKKAVPFIKDSEGNVIGVCNEEKNVAGTYLHGLFDSKKFIIEFIKGLWQIKNAGSSREVQIDNISEYRENEYERLEKCFEENADIEFFEKLLRLK